MSKKLKFAIALGLVALGLVFLGYEFAPRFVPAQSSVGGVLGAPTPVLVYSPYPITPITATAAAGGATTLTIPAPVQSGFYNYVCYLAMEGGNDTTATVVTNATGSSTNFNSWANKISTISSASNDTGVLTYFNLSPPGCAKSASPTIATTFVSPNSTHEAYTWYATYFQAP